MKKIMIVMICIVLALTITACGNEPAEISDNDVATDSPAVPSEDTSEGVELDTDKVFTFSTEDFEGNAFTSDDLKDAKLVMINIWEPWCGPCVGEMPDLEKIYEEFKDQGLVILGVFAETGMDEDAAQILEECGITYPILRSTSEFDGFQTGYVPTTVFLTGEGKLMSEYPVIGAQSFDAWHSAVKGLLEVVEND